MGIALKERDLLHDLSDSWCKYLLSKKPVLGSLQPLLSR